jgi:hypothetical protein
MSEHPIVFGEYEHLVGVISESSTGEPPAPVGVIFLTSGMLHHVGPFRLYVLMANQLARSGIASLRFCLSGIGESLGVGDSHSSLERAVCETRQAMDVLQDRFGIHQFILFGLCSGADDGMHIATEDKRVIGVSLMDGCGYPTWGFYWRRYAVRMPMRMLNPRCWFLWASRLRRRQMVQANTLTGGDDIREFPPRRIAEQNLQALVNRGVEMQFIYTGGVPRYYNHASQFWGMFPNLRSLSRIQVVYFPQLDHVARLAEDRQQIIVESTRWMECISRRSRTACDVDGNQAVEVAPLLNASGT